MFALTELGFLGQTVGHKMTLTETERNHTAVVIESKPHLDQKTRCHRDEGDQEKMDIEEVATEDNLEEQLEDWAREAEREFLNAQAEDAAERRAAWLVQGAYGHSRLRQTLFGGVTRGLLTDAPVPLVLGH